MISGDTLSLLGALATVAASGVGLLLPLSVGAEILKGIGSNLGSNLVQSGFSLAKERWFNSRDGLLNHDIQKALARSFHKALLSLEAKYLESDAAGPFKDFQKDHVRKLFEDLSAHAQDTLLASVGRMLLDDQLKRYLIKSTDLNTESLWAQLVGDNLLDSYGDAFSAFIREHLLDETLLWFAEELKTDSPENNRAWRAFQRMLLEGIYAEVKAVRSGNESISRDLRKLDALKDEIVELQGVIDRRLPDEPFKVNLDRAMVGIHATLGVVTQTSQRIDHNVELIRDDVRKLVDYHELKIGDATSGGYLEEKRTAYRVLWEKLQDAHIKFRSEAVSPEQFNQLVRDVNSYLLKQSLYIGDEERALANKYLNGIYRFKEILESSAEEEAKGDWNITADIPPPVIDRVNDLRHIHNEVEHCRGLLTGMCMKVINDDE